MSPVRIPRPVAAVSATPAAAAPAAARLAAVLVAALVALPPAPAAGQDLTRITGVAPALADSSSRSVNWVDFDVDGDLDLYVTNGGTLFEKNELYRNDGAGTFTPLPFAAPSLDSLRADGSTWGDYDNDGDPDLFVVSWYGEVNALFRNDGAGDFTRMTTGPHVTTGTHSEGCAWVDYDGDGDLDLYVANSGNGDPGSEDNILYRNDDGIFVAVTGTPIVNEGSVTRGPAWGDYDNDGDVDLFLANEGGENNRLFRNMLAQTGSAVFLEVDAGPVTSDGGNSWSGSWGDYDNDGDLDLVVGNNGGEFNFLYRNELAPTGTAAFTAITDHGPALNRGWIAGTHWADWDNDADLDLVLTNGWAAFPSQRKRNFYYRNDGGVLNREQGSAAAADSGWSYGGAWGDHDDDGDLDLVVAKWFGSGEENLFYRNEAQLNGNHWLRVRCVGVASNASGIGCRIAVTATIGGEPVTQIREITGADGYCSQTLEAHFGLGDATGVHSVAVRWPNGTVQTLTGVAADAVLVVTEEAGGVGAPVLPAGAGDRVRLGVVRPNPFRRGTVVEWTVPAPQSVRLFVADAAGRRVRELRSGPAEAGGHRTAWDGRTDAGRAAASGVYFVRLLAEDGAVAAQRVTLLR